MTRSSFRPVAAVGLVAATLVYVGCTKTDPTVAPPSSSTGSSQASTAGKSPEPAKEAVDTKPAASKDPFAFWAAQPPSAVLVVSGEQHGYLQPCGCTEGQLGGLGRRADMIDQIRKRGWPVAAVDLGDLLAKPAETPGGLEQEKVKFIIGLKALAMMKYDAIALGAEDMKLGVGELLGQLLNIKEPRFLAANVKPAAGFEETMRATALVKAGTTTLGVTAVLDPADFEALADPDKKDLLTITPPDEALPGAIETLQKGGAGLLVLLVQGKIEEARRLAEKFPQFDLVVARSVFADPDARPELLNDGKTTLINVGLKGKYAGVVGIFPGSGKPRLDYRLVGLEQKYFRETDEARTLVDVDYQNILRDLAVVATIRRRPNMTAPTGATYIGAQACQECHPKTFEKWRGTKHANAYAALENPKRNREADAECVSCHTTGFSYASGWVSASKTPYLKGNQCENCHGPASLHASDPDNPAFRKPMALSAETAEKTNFCLRCHDEDNDHNFTFAGRYSQIYHKGFDTYDDPKVHQPRAPKVTLDDRR
jgi:hypothetical protein